MSIDGEIWAAWQAARDAERVHAHAAQQMLQSVPGVRATETAMQKHRRLSDAEMSARADMRACEEGLQKTCRVHTDAMNARLGAAAQAFFAARPGVPRIRWHQTVDEQGELDVYVLEPSEGDDAYPDAVRTLAQIPAPWMWQEWSTARGAFTGTLTAAGIELPYTRF